MHVPHGTNDGSNGQRFAVCRTSFPGSRASSLGSDFHYILPVYHYCPGFSCCCKLTASQVKVSNWLVLINSIILTNFLFTNVDML